MKKVSTILLFIIIATSIINGQILGIANEEATQVGIYIKDLKTGKVIVENNASLAMTPASITKAVTAATVLQLKGAETQFQTEVKLSGTQCGQVFDGNIEITAVGDPTIESRNLQNNVKFVDSIVAKIVERGIKTISGQIKVTCWHGDEGVNPYWETGDVGWSYGAGLWGLNYKDNCYSLRTDDNSTEPEIPNLHVTTVKTGAGEEEMVIKGVNSDNIYVSGPKVTEKGYKILVTMDNPAEVLENDLLKRLATAGVQVNNQEDIAADGGDTIIYVYKSPTYGKIMKSMMTRSDNLFAEAMLRTIDGGESRAKAISTELKYWKSQGLNVDVVTLRDGSGLARGNKFSPKFLGELLAKMAEGKNCATYVKLFPIVGQEGTVRNFLKDTALQGKMVMKSGSMSGVHCYAGYKIDKDGTPTHAVVVMVNNFYCQRAQVKKAIEKLLLNNLQ